MGSSSNQKYFSPQGYILGLWGADGYQRTSSIGLTTIYPELVNRFADYFRQTFIDSRIKLRIYTNNKQPVSMPHELRWYTGQVRFAKGTKLRSMAFQIYVNSRPLLRHFKSELMNRSLIKSNDIIPYLAGRFDGDGSVAKDRRRDWRIVYGKISEAKIDQQLMCNIGINNSRVYHYRTAGTYVLYVSRFDSESLCRQLQPYSAKLSGLLVTP